MRSHFKILLCLLMIHGSQLAAQNIMSLSSAEGVPQDVVEIELSITNADSFVAFQTEIPLDDNLYYVENSAVLYRNVDHQLVASVVDGTLKLYSFSLSGKTFNGNDGVIATFQLRLGNEPGVFPLNHTKAKIVDASGSALQLSTTNSSVTVVAPKVEISTPQLDYGHIPIRSSYNKTLIVRNRGNASLTISGLQFSDASLSCPSFHEKVVAAGSSASFTIVYSPTVAGSVTYDIVVVSNAANGNQTAKVTADPYSVNELHIMSTSGICDSIVEVSVKMNNMDAITGLQFCIKMPTALQYQSNSFELTSRKADHLAAANMRNDTLVMVAYSPSNAAFNGEDGIIATFKVKIKGNSGYHYLYPKSVILTNADAENVMSNYYNGYVSVKSPKIYTNSSHRFTTSSVTEVVENTFRITNNGDAPLRIDSVKFNDRQLYCLSEFPLVINSYGNDNITICCARENEGEFNSTMRVYSNDPTSGLKLVQVTGNRYEPNGLVLDNDEVTELKYLDILVNMNNYSRITALQADFSFPDEYYTLQSSDITLSERCQGFSLTSVPINDSTFKIIMFSMSNAIISGNEGNILKIRLTRKVDADNETATVSMKNIILSDVKGNNKNSEGNQIKKIELKTSIAISLSAGWNWFSTNLNIEGEEGFEMLMQSLGDNALVVKSQMEFVKYYDEYDIWSGSLTTIDNDNMYKINMKNEHTITMQGFMTDASNFNLTLKPGWNWISYPLNEELNLNDIDFGFTPKQGDYIKSRDYFARYYEGYGWSGSLEVLKPGEGYIYNNTDEEEKVLKYSKKNN